MPGQPAFTLFFWNGRTEGSDTVGSANHDRGFGWGVSTSDRMAVATRSINAVGTSDAEREWRADACIATALGGGSLGPDGLVDYTPTSDGFTLTTDDSFAGTPPRVMYLAVGGTGITATQAEFLEPGSAGDQDHTVTGFASTADDQCVLFASMPVVGTLPGTDSDTRATYGWAGNDGAGGIANFVWLGGADDNAATMVTRSYCRAGECTAAQNAPNTVINRRAGVTAWLTDGFRLNWSEVLGVNTRFSYLAIKGVKNLSTSILTQTDTTTDITIGSLASPPLAALYMSACKAASAADTLDNDDDFSVGVATLSDELALGSIDENGTADSEIATAIRYADVYANVSTADAIEGAMGVTAWGSTSITHRMSDADPAQAFVGVLVFLGVQSPPPFSASRNNVRTNAIYRM
jgi:hypothetical protein